MVKNYWKKWYPGVDIDSLFKEYESYRNTLRETFNPPGMYADLRSVEERERDNAYAKWLQEQINNPFKQFEDLEIAEKSFLAALGSNICILAKCTPEQSSALIKAGHALGGVISSFGSTYNDRNLWIASFKKVYDEATFSSENIGGIYNFPDAVEGNNIINVHVIKKIIETPKPPGSSVFVGGPKGGLKPGNIPNNEDAFLERGVYGVTSSDTFLVRTEGIGNKPGSYGVHLFPTQSEAFEFAKIMANSGEKSIRDNFGLLPVWNDGSPGNPVDVVRIYKVPSGTQYIQGVVGEQTSNGGIVYKGMGPQVVIDNTTTLEKVGQDIPVIKY